MRNGIISQPILPATVGSVDQDALGRDFELSSDYNTDSHCGNGPDQFESRMPYMRTVRRLDEVSIFKDRLMFLIPHEWIEVASGDDGSYQYQVADAQSGWFRASLITTKDVAKPAERLEKFFRGYDGVSNEATGNLIRRSEKHTVQDGENLHIYYWFIGGCVAPNMVCEAVFSYIVLADLAENSETRSEVNFIDQLVSDARFNPTDDRTVRPESE